MDSISAIVLGFVQGATEFLPISSSGHLVFARELLGIEVSNALALDAVLHLATAFVVLVYFRDDWRSLLSTTRLVLARPLQSATKEGILWWGIVVGTLPAVIAGIFLEDIIAQRLYVAPVTAGVLVAGACFFMLAEWYTKRSARMPLSISRAAGIGVFQMLALLPGMSRAGATIAGGLFLGVSREEATRFSFLLALPITLGVGGMKLTQLGIADAHALFSLPLLLSALTAGVVGWFAIHYFLAYVKRYTLVPFAIYKLVLAVVVVVWLV